MVSLRIESDYQILPNASTFAPEIGLHYQQPSGIAT
jgi:hypothetical protein